MHEPTLPLNIHPSDKFRTTFLPGIPVVDHHVLGDGHLLGSGGNLLAA